MLYLTTLTDTQSVGLLWTRDRPEARELNLTKHNTHKRETDMLLAGFEPAIPASERPQTEALDRAATGIGTLMVMLKKRQKNAISTPLFGAHMNTILPFMQWYQRPSYKINLKFYYQ